MPVVAAKGIQNRPQVYVEYPAKCAIRLFRRLLDYRVVRYAVYVLYILFRGIFNYPRILIVVNGEQKEKCHYSANCRHGKDLPEVGISNEYQGLSWHHWNKVTSHQAPGRESYSDDEGDSVFEKKISSQDLRIHEL